jgi:hypothetical protein
MLAVYAGQRSLRFTGDRCQTVQLLHFPAARVCQSTSKLEPDDLVIDTSVSGTCKQVHESHFRRSAGDLRSHRVGAERRGCRTLVLHPSK